MVLAESVKDSYQRSNLPAGHTLSDENLHQLTAHHIEFICISEADTRSDQTVAAETETVAKRVRDIFDKADLSDPVMAALFHQVLKYRSA